jgi:hypothetical protein
MKNKLMKIWHFVAETREAHIWSKVSFFYKKLVTYQCFKFVYDFSCPDALVSYKVILLIIKMFYVTYASEKKKPTQKCPFEWWKWKYISSILRILTFT